MSKGFGMTSGYINYSRNRTIFLQISSVSAAELQRVTQYTIKLSRNAESNEKSPLICSAFRKECSSSDTSSCDRSHLLSDQPAWQQHAQSHADPSHAKRTKGGRKGGIFRLMNVFMQDVVHCLALITAHLHDWTVRKTVCVKEGSNLIIIKTNSNIF